VKGLALSDPGQESGPELSVVMPVFNEETLVPGVILELVECLDSLAANYEILVYDDGSTDGTLTALHRLQEAVPRLEVRSHTNRGHGPTLWRGYREARGRWVLQLDSDGEVPPSELKAVWGERETYDFLVGFRTGIRGTRIRRLLSGGAKGMISILFGRGFSDPNCPFRLMRRSCLVRLLPRIPPATFAPNPVLSGLAVRNGFRILEFPVTFRPRPSGGSKLVNRRLVEGVVKALIQTWRIWWRWRRVPLE